MCLVCSDRNRHRPSRTDAALALGPMVAELFTGWSAVPHPVSCFDLSDDAVWRACGPLGIPLCDEGWPSTWRRRCGVVVSWPEDSRDVLHRGLRGGTRAGSAGGESSGGGGESTAAERIAECVEFLLERRGCCLRISGRCVCQENATAIHAGVDRRIHAAGRGRHRLYACFRRRTCRNSKYSRRRGKGQVS